MKKIKLLKMEIENFKGVIGKRVFEFSDRTSISGENASGKTTLADAFFWTLFGYDSQGSGKFQVRPLNSLGKQMDNIVITVCLLLSVDGREVEVKKIQKQNWVKKRGTDVTEFKGNINEYEVDGFPKGEKEFKEFVESLIEEDLFRMLTNPLYFVKKEWKKQREILFQLITDISDEDIIDSSPKKFGGLRLALSVHKIDDLTAKAKKTLADLKKKQDEYPTRIDEASKSLVHIDIAEKELQKADLMRQIAAIEKQEEDSTTQFDEFQKHSDQIMDVKMKMSYMEREANSGLISQRLGVQSRIDAAELGFKTAMKKHTELEKEVERLKAAIDKDTEEKDSLLKQYYAAKATALNDEAWAFNPDDMNCPMCGQALPGDELEKRRQDFETRKKEAIEKFEKEKAALVSSIQSNGSALTAKIASMNADILEFESKIDAAKADKLKYNAEKNNALMELETVPEKADVSQNIEYRALVVELTELEKQLASINTVADYRQQLRIKKAGLKEELTEVEKIILSVSRNEEIEERIAELQAEQKECGQLIVSQEKDLFLYEEFARTKMNMISSRINEKFKTVNFKLFDMQVNGGMKETCECTVNGVAFSDLNNGHKIIAGLDIINTLSGLYEIQAPIWLDNAESINDYNLPDIESQLILLSVSNDTELKIENIK